VYEFLQRKIESIIQQKVSADGSMFFLAAAAVDFEFRIPNWERENLK